MEQHTHPGADTVQTASHGKPVSLEQGLEQADIPAAKLDTQEGQVKAAEAISDKSADTINAIPEGQLHALDQSVALEQLKLGGRDILMLLNQLKAQGRIQMGVTSAATAIGFVIPGVSLVGSVGSHMIGWNEVDAKKRLVNYIDAFCKTAAASNIETDRLEEVSKAMGNPLSKRRGLRIRSIFTSIFLPLARGMHRLIKQGKYDEVQHEVERILQLAGDKGVITPAAEKRPADIVPNTPAIAA